MNQSAESAKAAPPESCAGGALDGGGLFPKHFVYILRSLANPRRTYTGHTDNPKERLNEHNNGECSYTSKFRPWRMETVIGFTDELKAIRFERYLKTGSGRAFSKSHMG